MGLLSWLNRPVVNRFDAIGVRTGDDIVMSIRDRLDSYQAFAMLDALSSQFPKTRIHLLTGFGPVTVKGNDGGGSGDNGKDSANPPLPMRVPSGVYPLSRLAQASEGRGISIISYATGSQLIAVFVPPEQQRDSVLDPHVIPPTSVGEHGNCTLPWEVSRAA